MPMSSTTNELKVIPQTCALGEAPVWDSASAKLTWVDRDQSSRTQERSFGPDQYSEGLHRWRQLRRVPLSVSVTGGVGIQGAVERGRVRDLTLRATPGAPPHSP